VAGTTRTTRSTAKKATAKATAKKTVARKAATRTPTRKSTPAKKVSTSSRGTGLSSATLVDTNRRPDIESYLDGKGVKWRYLSEVKIDEIDLEKSLRNQARIKQKVDEEVITRYVEAMERGDVFPPIIFARGGRSASAKFVNIDGNHRVISKKKAGDEVYTYGAYEVYDADPQVIVMMTFEANTKHGLPTSEEERVHQAIWLIDNGATKKAAAQAVNVPEKAINKLWNKVVADRRADEVGILRSHWDHLSQSIKNRLNTVQTDEGFAALVELVYKAKLDWDEVNGYVNEINGSRSGTKQKAMVANWTDVLQDRIQANLGGGLTNASRRGATPLQRYRMTLGAVLGLPDDVNGLAAQFAPQERSEAAQRAREAAKRFTALAKALDAAS
jgi:hypothetical protein